MNYLIESALLVHGIKNLDDETILHYWGDLDGQIVWMESGRIVTGGIDRLLDFRRRCREAGTMPRRANHYNLDKYMEIAADAVLTASGAMSVCARIADGTADLTGSGYRSGDLPAAVTAGIGGFFPEMLEENGSHLWTKGFGPPDVATLDELQVVLVSSGPKDMLDYKGTIRFLDEHGVIVRGVKRDSYSGYIFIGEEAPLPGVISQDEAPLSDQGGDGASCLIINEISADLRLSDRSILDAAVEYALEEEKKGGYYHPAVNAKLEELTRGYSARLQLGALTDNARLAAQLR